MSQPSGIPLNSNRATRRSEEWFVTIKSMSLSSDVGWILLKAAINETSFSFTAPSCAITTLAMEVINNANSTKIPKILILIRTFCSIINEYRGDLPFRTAEHTVYQILSNASYVKRAFFIVKFSPSLQHFSLYLLF